MRLVEATLMDLIFIAAHLRPSDREELAATRDVNDYEKLAIDSFQSDYKCIGYDAKGFPALAFGAKALHPGVVGLWGFGTPSYRDSARSVTRHIRDDMIPALLKMGVHRGQCLVHPNNRASQKWLTALGFKPEATLSGFGSRREDMLLYAWVDDATPARH